MLCLYLRVDRVKVTVTWSCDINTDHGIGKCNPKNMYAEYEHCTLCRHKLKVKKVKVSGQPIRQMDRQKTLNNMSLGHVAGERKEMKIVKL